MAVSTDLAPQTPARRAVPVGTQVRLRRGSGPVPAGSIGRVVGYYRASPAEAVVCFATGTRIVCDRELDAVG